MSRTYTKEELSEVLEKHKWYLECRAEGTRADLSSADLSSADLSSADLRFANLSFANLSFANLRSADLSSANLRSADLRSADLSSADLRFADLSFANLRSADLSSANLSFANLRSADLSSADLRFANLSFANLRSAKVDDAHIDLLNYFILPEEGEFVAWKAVRSFVDREPVVLKLKVPENADRACSFIGRKCRVSLATPVAAFRDGKPCEETEFYSNHTSAFKWKIGEEHKPDSFDPNPRVECSNGLHVFITRKEAERYFS